MKSIKHLLTAAILLYCTICYAQVPESFNYQAVARDGSGSLIQNQSIAAIMGIYSGAGGANLEYEETHNLSTNEYGMINLKIGTGTVNSGNFSDINWGEDVYFLGVQLDVGSGLVNLGKTQLVSVPYAMHAKTVERGIWQKNSDNIYYDAGSAGIGIDNPLVKVHVISENSSGASGSALGSQSSTSQYLSPAVYGRSIGSTADITHGVFGNAYSNDAFYAMGVRAEGGGASVNNYGIYATDHGEPGSGYSIAVYGEQNGNGDIGNYAGYFMGDVYVAGNLAKSGGSFKIDHPLDPANKYLVHSFIESPDMMNVYNGNTTTNSNGTAVVTLPDYFETLNMDFRYQLTVIGKFAQAIVYEEISNNQFTIRTDQPNTKVSWLVTGIRQDPWANENRIVPEIDKKNIEKGKYLHPELYSRSEEEGLPVGIK